MPSLFHLHASAVALHGVGVLITGGSGAGKSSLVAAMLCRGAQLIADDQVVLQAQDGCLFASAPPSIHGLLEVVGVGVLRIASAATQPIKLGFEVALLPIDQCERLPESQAISHYAGVALPRVHLPARKAHVADVVQLLVMQYQRDGALLTVDVAKHS
jgi:HPr kinase/phosphorylase